MNKGAYNFVEISNDRMCKAAEQCGTSLNNIERKTLSSGYNVGIDEVLTDIALTALEAKAIAKSEPLLEEYKVYNGIFSNLLKEIEGNEKLEDMLFELDSQNGVYICKSRKELFVQGFIAGYKMLKNASLL